MEEISLESEVHNKERVENIKTLYGELTVTIHGRLSQPIIITYHDVGLNHRLCFEKLFRAAQPDDTFDSYCIIHVDAPGQAERAEELCYLDEYPTFDQLANQLSTLLDHFSIENFVGLGVGVGGNILCRLAMKRPETVRGLMIISTSLSRCTLWEWAWSKATMLLLDYLGMNSVVRRMLIRRYFSEKCPQAEELSPKLDFHNQFNLYKLICSNYMRDDILHVARHLTCETIVVFGKHSSYRQIYSEAYSAFDNRFCRIVEMEDSNDLLVWTQPGPLIALFLSFLHQL
eukprot:TRINITY_DN4280_c0_g1_i1.p1 TRINITY_DN4280_c0_g1~~TRINITY_DN4280_c0_g1_i1.p1  ORF type:complete len:287 (-),score=23.37 TRINITY_DN4280_c0_g1_i1:145-1005(-)